MSVTLGPTSDVACVAGHRLEGRFSVRAGVDGSGAGQRHCWDVVAGGVGPASDRSANRLGGVGDEAGESGNLDVEAASL